MSLLYVFKNNKAKQFVGVVKFTDPLITFQYDQSFLDDPSSESINPFQLPLDRARKFKFDKLNLSLSVFKDAMPGGWGIRVLEDIYNRKLSICELLLEDQKDRIGDLVFNLTKDFPDLTDAHLCEPFSWHEILSAQQVLENDQTLSDRDKMLLANGSSQGGEKAKVTIIKNNSLYLAKLPSNSPDRKRSNQIEYASMMLAKACGINVADTELISFGQQDILIIRRFDRVTGDSHSALPYLSLASICGVQYAQDSSYLEFAKQLQRLSGKSDLEELFKRMVFNIMISNKDDHYLNHGTLFKNGKWMLSPAFDVVSGEGRTKNQAMIVGAKGKESTLINALSKANVFNLDEDKAYKIVSDLIDAVSNWKNRFSEFGISDETIESIAWAMLNDDIFIGMKSMGKPISK